MMEGFQHGDTALQTSRPLGDADQVLPIQDSSVLQQNTMGVLHSMQPINYLHGGAGESAAAYYPVVASTPSAAPPPVAALGTEENEQRRVSRFQVTKVVEQKGECRSCVFESGAGDGCLETRSLASFPPRQTPRRM